MAVNKNTDALYCELIAAEPIDGAACLAKARDIIGARTAPPRISNSPSWFACRFCDFKRICHHGDPIDKNCRTCRNSVPVDGGEWFCEHWGQNIPDEHIKTGCTMHSDVTD